MSEFEQPPAGGVSRRTVTKAMAWAVPAIAIAAPVPAFAGASQGEITLTGEGCKLPGNSNAPYNTNGAFYTLTISNTTNAATTITISQLDRTGSGSITTGFSLVALTTTAGQTCCTLLGTTITVAPHSSATYALVSGGWSNSANGTLTVHYSVDGVQKTSSTPGNVQLGPAPSGGNCTGGSCSVPDAYAKCVYKAVGSLAAGCTASCS